ncbi:hypothetical protein VZQ01_10655 [Myxococcus faecalis]|uniref:hypothetical protein n=1 Tax=Myxococcus faecalis TaxID=3115646 RepID=UPI0038D020A8
MSNERTERPTNEQRDGMVSAVARIAADSELYDVRTIGTYARLHADAPDVGTPLTAGLSINLNCQLVENELRVIGKFEVKAHAEGKPKRDSFFTANLHLVAYYRVHPGLEFNDEKLQAFASTNGMVHLWPYFRAFVQQTCGQFAIPAIVMPPFRVNQPFKNLRYASNEGDVPGPTVDPLAPE